MRSASGSLKARLLAAAGRATMTIQTETPPYKYASIEGPVTIGPPALDRLELATRYLGPGAGPVLRGQHADRGPVEVRLRPEHWRTHDYAKGL